MSVLAWLLLCLAVIQFGRCEEEGSIGGSSIAVAGGVIPHTIPSDSIYSNHSTNSGFAPTSDDSSQTRRARRSVDSDLADRQREFNESSTALDRIKAEMAEATDAWTTLTGELGEARERAGAMKDVYDGALVQDGILATAVTDAQSAEGTARTAADAARGAYATAIDGYEEELVTLLRFESAVPSKKAAEEASKAPWQTAKRDQAKVEKELKIVDDAVQKKATQEFVQYEADVSLYKTKQALIDAKVAAENAKTALNLEGNFNAATTNKNKADAYLKMIENNEILTKKNTEPNLGQLTPGRAITAWMTKISQAKTTYEADKNDAQKEPAAKERLAYVNQVAEFLKQLQGIDDTKKIKDLQNNYANMKSKAEGDVTTATTALGTAQKAFDDNEKIITDAAAETAGLDMVGLKATADDATEELEKVETVKKAAEAELNTIAVANGKAQGDPTVWAALKVDAATAVTTTFTAYDLDKKAHAAARLSVTKQKGNLGTMRASIKNKEQKDKNDAERDFEKKKTAREKAEEEKESKKNYPNEMKAEWEAATALVGPLEEKVAAAQRTKLEKDAASPSYYNAKEAAKTKLDDAQTAKDEAVREDKEHKERVIKFGAAFGAVGGILLLSVPIAVGVFFYTRKQRRKKKEAAAKSVLPPKVGIVSREWMDKEQKTIRKLKFYSGYETLGWMDEDIKLGTITPGRDFEFDDLDPDLPFPEHKVPPDFGPAHLDKITFDREGTRHYAVPIQPPLGKFVFDDSPPIPITCALDQEKWDYNTRQERHEHERDAARLEGIELIEQTCSNTETNPWRRERKLKAAREKAEKLKKDPNYKDPNEMKEVKTLQEFSPGPAWPGNTTHEA